MADNQNFLLKVFEKAAASVSAKKDAEETDRREHSVLRNCIGFYEPYEGCGMTTAIINVATVLASKGYTVCIVDLNVLKPDVYRTLKPKVSSKKYHEQSIRLKLLNSLKPAVEIVNNSSQKNIYYVSSRLAEHPSNYCGNNDGDTQIKQVKEALISLFAELSVIYDFVFLDMPSDITDIFALTGISGSDLMFTFLDGSMRATNLIYKNDKVLQDLGLPKCFEYLIQGKIIGRGCSANDYKQVLPYATLLLNIPYSKAVEISGLKNAIFLTDSRTVDAPAQMARTRYKMIADLILEYQKKQSLNVANYEEEFNSNVTIVYDNTLTSEYVLEGAKLASKDEDLMEVTYFSAAAEERAHERKERLEKHKKEEEKNAIHTAELEELEEAETRRLKHIALEEMMEKQRKERERAAKREKEQAMKERIRAIANGVEVAEETEKEFEAGADLIRFDINFNNDK